MNTWESLIASRNRDVVPCRIADPVKRRAYRSKLAYYKTEKGKESRKEADARFRENHRQERNEYSRNYYASHREYYAEYRRKLKEQKEVKPMPCGSKKPTKKVKTTKKK